MHVSAGTVGYMRCVISSNWRYPWKNKTETAGSSPDLMSIGIWPYCASYWRDTALLCFVLERLLDDSRYTIFIKHGGYQVYPLKNSVGTVSYSLNGLQMEIRYRNGMNY